MSDIDFHVGMKVLCVAPKRKPTGRVSDRDGPVGYAMDPQYPQPGETYTVRHVNQVDEDKVLLLLDEVRNDHLRDFISDGLEPGFDAKFFALVEGAQA